jgi:hypothetical protein
MFGAGRPWLARGLQRARVELRWLLLVNVSLNVAAYAGRARSQARQIGPL